jgi:flagellar basal body rod protein FlgB
LLAESVANIDTTGYVQKDLDGGKFREMLGKRVEERASAGGGDVKVNGVASSEELDVVADGQLFHDGQNRSMESLMSESAKNALTHNMFVELMRKQFSSIDMALKERVG